MPTDADPSQPADPTPAPTPAPAFDEVQLKAAMTAFKKRLKLTRLDDESKLGGGRPVTGGKKSAIVGIVPPREFPREVWAELVRQNKLKDTGGGFYAPV